MVATKAVQFRHTSVNGFKCELAYVEINESFSNKPTFS